MENRIFLLHASQASKLNGTMGLTENQIVKMKELQDRLSVGIKPLTENMKEELHCLTLMHLNPELPQTAKTFLNEWFANEREDIFSKYTAKGNAVEIDNIDFMAKVLDLGFAAKNEKLMSNDFFAGTADVVLKDRICDVKSCWSKKTLNDVIIGGFDPAYELQGQVYMNLWGKKHFNLFYGLQNTPAEVNYDKEITYDHLKECEKFINFEFNYDETIINHLIERIKAARVYLAKLEEKVSHLQGKTHIATSYKSIINLLK